MFGLLKSCSDYAFKHVVFALAEVQINACSDYQGCTVCVVCSVYIT